MIGLEVIDVGMERKVSHTPRVLMARPFIFLAFCGLGLSLRVNAELPQPRAPRLLRLVDGAGKALQGDCFAPQFSASGDGVFFLRGASEGPRSLWFASPLTRSGERYPAWQATPVLKSAASLRLHEAVALRGDSKLFITIGAEEGQASATQLARTEIGKSIKVNPLWAGHERMGHIAPSPDGATVVFTRYMRDWQGRETPQLWRIASDANQEKPLLVTKSARRAVWLDDSTLVFERLVGTETAYYSLNPFTADAPRFLLRGSGEGACIGKGQGIVFSALPMKSPKPSLFMLSRDGSGLRRVVGTDGARRPTVSGDGNELAYDAPDPKSGAVGLWVAALAAPQKQAPFNPISLHAPRPKAGQVDLCQLAPMPLPPPAGPSVPEPQPTLLPTSTPLPAPKPEPGPAPTATPRALSAKADKADLDVAGTLANIPVNGKMKVTFWAKNRGTRVWNADDVRVVIRWVDFDSGGRRRWEYKWLKGPVAPLGQFRLPMEITAPNKPGRYKIIYSLMRLPSKGASINPPPFDASQDVWPGEFAATAFAVNVN